MTIADKLLRAKTDYDEVYYTAYGQGKGAGIEQGYEEGYEAGYADGVAGSSVTFQKDDSAAYLKTIPNNAEPKAMLLSVGGMTKKCSNLVNATTLEHTNGVYMRLPINLPSGQYTISLSKKIYWAGQSSNIARNTANNVDTITFTKNDNAEGYIEFRDGTSSSTEWDDSTTIMLNEGTTALPYEPYYEGFRESKVTEIISLDSEGNEITRRAIPEEITALEGYGEGVDEYSNTIDLVNKELAMYGKKYTFTGSEKWTVGGTTSKGMYRYYVSMSNSKKSTGANGLCDKYPTFRGHYNENTTESVRFGQANSALYLYLYEDITATEVAERVKGMTVFYELEEPKVVDLSTALADFDNILDVERGGSLEFVNEHRHAVPSSILYTKKVGT